MVDESMIAMGLPVNHSLEHPDSAGVYFLLCNDRVKIGRAKNIKNRLLGYTTTAPYPIRLLAVWSEPQDEAKFHAELKESRTHGEWFKPTREMGYVIQRVLGGEIELTKATVKRRNPFNRQRPSPSKTEWVYDRFKRIKEQKQEKALEMADQVNSCPEVVSGVEAGQFPFFQVDPQRGEYLAYCFFISWLQLRSFSLVRGISALQVGWEIAQMGEPFNEDIAAKALRDGECGSYPNRVARRGRFFQTFIRKFKIQSVEEFEAKWFHMVGTLPTYDQVRYLEDLLGESTKYSPKRSVITESTPIGAPPEYVQYPKAPV